MTAGRAQNSQQKSRDHPNLTSEGLRHMGGGRNHPTVNFSYNLEKY